MFSILVRTVKLPNPSGAYLPDVLSDAMSLDLNICPYEDNGGIVMTARSSLWPLVLVSSTAIGVPDGLLTAATGPYPSYQCYNVLTGWCLYCLP